jgi:7-cyano-7-deazaguanine synthase
MPGAVCLTSGGQDSTTCLFWARQRFAPLFALAFDYGQRHRLELQAAQSVCDLADVPLTILPLDILRRLGGTALLDPNEKIQAAAGSRIRLYRDGISCF